MINLIPTHARKDVKTEYWVRVVTVWLFLLAAAAGIVGLLLFPSYMLVQSGLSIFEDTYQDISQQNESYETLREEVRVGNGVANHIGRTEVTPVFIMIINELESLANTNVSLASYSFARTEGKVESISITGSAPSRASLAQFRDVLESHEFFDSAELPISNLAKDKDIPFNITIITSNVLHQ